MLIPVGESEIDLEVSGEVVKENVTVGSQDESLDITNEATHTVSVNVNGSNVETKSVSGIETIHLNLGPEDVADTNILEFEHDEPDVNNRHSIYHEIPNSTGVYLVNMDYDLYGSNSNSGTGTPSVELEIEVFDDEDNVIYSDYDESEGSRFANESLIGNVDIGQRIDRIGLDLYCTGNISSSGTLRYEVDLEVLDL